MAIVWGPKLSTDWIRILRESQPFSAVVGQECSVTTRCSFSSLAITIYGTLSALYQIVKLEKKTGENHVFHSRVFIIWYNSEQVLINMVNIHGLQWGQILYLRKKCATNSSCLLYIPAKRHNLLYAVGPAPWRHYESVINKYLIK